MYLHDISLYIVLVYATLFLLLLFYYTKVRLFLFEKDTAHAFCALIPFIDKRTCVCIAFSFGKRLIVELVRKKKGKVKVCYMGKVFVLLYVEKRGLTEQDTSLELFKLNLSF